MFTLLPRYYSLRYYVAVLRFDPGAQGAIEKTMVSFAQDIPGGRRLRAGMVGGGPGSFFAGYHRAAMRLSNRFELVAGAFSSDPASCRHAGQALGISSDRIYLSFRDMVMYEAKRGDPIDVAVIVTPNHLHFDPCRLFLEAGIPVVCEKPMVNELEDARRLVSQVRSTGTFFAVTYTYCGYPMVRDARARIQRGDLGDIRFMYVEYLLEWLANDPSKLGSKGGIWRGDPSKAGPTGALGDVGTHAFQLLEYLSGKRCTSLNARLSRLVPGRVLDDTDLLQPDFEGGIEGVLWASLAAPGHRNGLRFKIVGSKGTLEWRQEAPETLLHGRLGQGDIIYHRGDSDMTEAGASSVSLPAGSPEGYIEALTALYTDFADVLDNEDGSRDNAAVPYPDVIEGARGVALSHAAVESNESRRWVNFPAL
jgi:predicted dehydrogenase